MNTVTSLLATACIVATQQSSTSATYSEQPLRRAAATQYEDVAKRLIHAAPAPRPGVASRYEDSERSL